VSATPLKSSEAGQALIVVAIAVAVLVASLAFAVDWGYAMAQRRVMQNLADAAALGAGKYLATAVIEVNGGPAFTVTQEETWCAAKSYDAPNRSFVDASAPTQLDVFYGTTSPTVWTTSAQPAGGTCPTTGGTAIPSSTIYVRVRATVTFRSLIAAVVGHSSSTSAASARVRLSGTPVPLSGPLWSMVRHYDASDYNISCTGTCDPTQIDPVEFWSANGNNVVYGNFKGLIDYSRDSPAFGGIGVTTPQLIEQWDTSSHSPKALKIDMSGGNCRAWGQDALGNWLWDSAGEANTNQDKQCSIPNWFYYSFRGTLSLSSKWRSGIELPTGQEPPTPLTNRSICTSPPSPAPSCTDATVGDWLEAASGNVGTNMSSAMAQAIADRGRPMPYSDKLVPHGHGQTLGKGLVILVYLWDCGETFSSSAPSGSRWNLIVPSSGPGSGDCSQLKKGNGGNTPDRVHVFTVAPFTFYAGLVDSNSISGYWGGSFGDPDACANCALNPLANTAVMVPDN